MKGTSAAALAALHALLAVYSLSNVCSKLAAGEAFLSARFCFFYGAMLALLAVYAVVWQQLLKRLPLTLAFANRAVTLAWGLVWGVVCFHESVTPGKLAGIALTAAGVLLFVRADGEGGGRDG